MEPSQARPSVEAPHRRQQRSPGAAPSSVTTDTAVAAAQAGAAGFTGSVALLAAALVTAACAVVQLIATAERRRAQRARRGLPPRHPAGHGGEQVYWPLAVSTLLLGMAAAFVVPLGGDRLSRPTDLRLPEVAVAVAVATALVTTRPLARTAAVAEVERGMSGWWAYLCHLRRPELPGALTRAAVTAAAAASAAVATIAEAGGGAVGPALDATGALVVAVVAGAGAVTHMALLRELVAGHPAPADNQQAVTAAVEVEPCVSRLAHLETHLLGPGELLVGGRVTLVRGLDAGEVAGALQRIESSIRRAVPEVRAVYLQPELRVTTLPRDLEPPPPPAAAGAGPARGPADRAGPPSADQGAKT